MSGLSERSKVNLDLWKLFIAIVTLDLTYQVRIMTMDSVVFMMVTLMCMHMFTHTSTTKVTTIALLVLLIDAATLIL